MTTDHTVDGLSIDELREVAPSTVGVDDIRPTGARVPGQRLTKNVGEVGVVEPPLVREQHGELVALDGTRRLAAAQRAGFDDVHVLVVSGDDVDALAAWLNLHTFGKPVTDEDREAAVRRLVDAPARGRCPPEFTEAVEQAKFDLALRTTADRIEDAVSPVEGVGRTIAEKLANEFGSLDATKNAAVEAFAAVSGIGRKRAKRMHEEFRKQRNGVIDVHE